ncbi:hypothetical protein GE21DRAFT_1322038 [Neurospora crassa]|nr:hypothetical protein GE21DRAFT_1322038 [Neurospora crassa]
MFLSPFLSNLRFTWAQGHNGTTSLITPGTQVYEEAPCPLTISIVLPDVVLTAVTIQPASSPTACCATDVDKIFFYTNNNATSPYYVDTLAHGFRCLLDLSPEALAAGRLAAYLSNGESIIFDETGMHYYGAGCNTTTSVAISNFLAQLAGLPDASPSSGADQRGRRIRKRDLPETNFTVAVQNITEWDIHSWTCQYPGANSSEKSCEDKFHSLFKPGSPSLSGPGLDQTGNALFNFVPRLINRVEKNIANLFPGISEPLQHGLAWLNNAHNAVLHAADLAHHWELPLAAGSNNHRGVRVPSRKITKEPPRQVVPTETSFPNVTETSFSEIPDIPDLASTLMSAEEKLIKADITPFTSLGSLLDAPLEPSDAEAFERLSTVTVTAIVTEIVTWFGMTSSAAEVSFVSSTSAIDLVAS